MQHRRPEGLSQGYFCHNCGAVCGMLGHTEPCAARSELVKQLTELNMPQSERKESFYGMDRPALCAKIDRLRDEVDRLTVALREKDGRQPEITDSCGCVFCDVQVERRKDRHGYFHDRAYGRVSCTKQD